MAMEKTTTKLTKTTGQMKKNCLISYRAGDWHYRIFADFLKFRIQNGFQNRKCCNGQYMLFRLMLRARLLQKSYRSTAKEQLLYYCKELRLKTTGEKKDLIERLLPFGKCPDLESKTTYRYV